jgi:hypothetical protein
MVFVWLYLLSNWHKSQREFQKETGINPFSPFHSFGFLFDTNKTANQKEAFRKLKRAGLKNFLIWLLSILIFVAVTFIVGMATG